VGSKTIPKSSRIAYPTILETTTTKVIKAYPSIFLTLNMITNGVDNNVKNISAYNNQSHGIHILVSSKRFLNKNQVCQRQEGQSLP
jgi:hypothetical protein